MDAGNPTTTAARKPPVIGAGLRSLLGGVFLLFALLVVNSSYLGAITLLEYLRAETYQDFFYLNMFLVHLVLGLLSILPFLLFGALHLRRAIHHPNRNAVRAGAALFASGILVLTSGVLLTRFGFLEVDDPGARGVAYWLHVGSPFAAVWLFILHRLAGRRIRWAAGLRWAGVAAGFAACMVAWKLLATPRVEQPAQPAFANTLVATPGGQRLAARSLMISRLG